MSYLILLKLQDALLPIIKNNTLNYCFLSTLIVLALLFIYFSLKEFKNSLDEIQQIGSLRGKLDQYFEASHHKFIRFLFSGVICAAGLYITAHDLFILCYIIGLALLSLRRPSLSTFFSELNLSQMHKDILLEKKPIE